MNPPGSGSQVEFERRTGLWFVRLNRPDKRNSLSDDMLATLRDVLAEVALDEAARGLVIWGAGGHFCAGGDFARFAQLMNEPAGADADPIAAYNREFGRVLEAVVASPVPTLAVVQGSAIGGGCGLAAACDRVIAADDALFAMPEVTLGVAPAQIAPFVLRRCGSARGRWLLATGARLAAGEAAAAGLADVVAPSDALATTVARELAGLAAVEPRALHATLGIVERAARLPLDQCLDAAAVEFAGLLRHGHVREGLAAARERRTPAWRVPPPDLPEFT